MSTTQVSAFPRPAPLARHQAVTLVDRLKDSADVAYYALRAVLMIAGNGRIRPHGI